MISTMFLCLFLFIALSSLIFICLHYYNKRKRIGYKKYLELMDLGEELKAEIVNFIQKKTTINLKFIKLGNGDNYDKIKCEWIDSEIVIKDIGEFSSELKNNDKKETNFYINALVKKKLELIKNNKRKEFIIDIYLHQNNNYYIITDIQGNQTYSLDTIYYSKDSELIQKKLNFEKNELIIDNYNLDKMGRICLINIEKKSCINFINSISNLKLEENDKIFKNEIFDIFMNVKIKGKGLFESALFLNKNMNEVYDFTPEELNILKRFNEEIVVPNINKYKNFKTKDFNQEMKDNFKKSINEFTLRNFSGIYKKEDNIISNEEEIPLKNEEMEEEINYNLFGPIDTKKGKKIDMHLNITFQLKSLISKFFDSPIDIRYKNEPSQKDFELVEILCYLKLAVNAKLPLVSFINFHYYELKILNEVKDFSMREKIKIICCIQSHLTGFIPEKLKLQKIFDLPEYSPYLRGEIMYRNIIKNLNEKSKLKFIFLQLNSGFEYDFIQKQNCYLLKMIPLIIIKSQLLYNSEDYFFTYSNNRAKEYAFVDPYTRILSINEIKVFNAPDIAYEEEEDNSIKVGLIHFHENGGHNKFRKEEKSQRFLISALEEILLGKSNYIDTLMSCQDLRVLNNFQLFTDEDGTKLQKEIDDILEKNNAVGDIYDKKMININYNTMEGDKYSKLKSFMN